MDDKRVRVAENAGFCPGVERAVRLARRAAQEAGGQAQTLGELVHSNLVVSQLACEGITPAPSVEQATTTTVVIRTHGVPPGILEEAAARGLTVVDATCPAVKRVQQRARQLAKEGYRVLVIGKANHPEVVATVGWTGGCAMVIETEEQAASLAPLGKAGIVCQTTLPTEVFERIAAIIIGKAREAKVFNTTCPATRNNQSESQTIAAQVDLMLVIGSGHSANTRHLVDVCQDTGTRTVLIETPEEVSAGLLDSVESVGITGGASCPKEVVQQVAQRVEALLKEQVASA